MYVPLSVMFLYAFSQIWSMKLDLHFTTSTAHFSAFLSPVFSLLPGFASYLPGWLPHQPRQEFILEFCPWFPPISPWAVTCQCYPPLRAPTCRNYLWHPSSGASRQVTWWRGWVHRVERRKGRIFLCSWQDNVGTAADLPTTAGVKVYCCLLCIPITKTISLTFMQYLVTITYCVRVSKLYRLRSWFYSIDCKKVWICFIHTYSISAFCLMRQMWFLSSTMALNKSSTLKYHKNTWDKGFTTV